MGNIETAISKRTALDPENFWYGGVGISFGDVGDIGGGAAQQKKAPQSCITFTHAAPHHVRINPIYTRAAGAAHLPDSPERPDNPDTPDSKVYFS